MHPSRRFVWVMSWMHLVSRIVPALMEDTSSLSAPLECLAFSDDNNDASNGECLNESDPLTVFAKTKSGDDVRYCNAVNCTTDDIWDLFQCDDILENERPIHDDATWRYLRKIYQETMDPNFLSEVSADEEEPFSFETDVAIFQAPIEARHSPGKGRGLFAKEDIPAGTTLFRAPLSTHAIFPTDVSFRKYLLMIPAHLACDVMVWSYPVLLELTNSTTGVICTDLSETSFLNDAVDDDKENAKCHTDSDGICEMSYYASTNIKAGDEILAKYADFSSTELWWDVGLRSKGWDYANDDDDDDRSNASEEEDEGEDEPEESDPADGKDGDEMEESDAEDDDDDDMEESDTEDEDE
ncbi:SET methyltransferase domain containing protein [Nitzschia inconspicua]|uniref:SET methyltransferase domain containing protein n=1 Tax=Nitzschia inconspicua TaxID=303405 RepID=A0A9K3PUM8_9STRA|nr:SET methyltransferase domain containing protein [Nitzschia inconspicua]